MKEIKSGVKGVTWDYHRKHWVPQIKVDGKSKYLGRYKDLNEAIRARREAEIEFGG